MGYHIQYGETLIKKKIKLPYFMKNRNKIATMLIVTVICTTLGLIGKNERVQEILIPGDDEVTRAAFECMIDEVQAGSSMVDAVTVFCREILEGADLS